MKIQFNQHFVARMLIIVVLFAVVDLASALKVRFGDDRVAVKSIDLQTAMDLAESSNRLLLLQTGRLEALAHSMQDRADTIQTQLGNMGDPHIAVLMQEAKSFAREVLADVRRGSALALTISAELKNASSVLSMGTEYSAGDAAETIAKALVETTAKTLDYYSTKAKREMTKLLEVQHSISPRLVSSNAQSYWKILQYVSKDFRNAPSTCSGISVGKPIVGKSYTQCSQACDALMTRCIGFSFFPSMMCFLFEKIKAVTYYPGCKRDNDNTTSPIESGMRVSCSVKPSAFAAHELRDENHSDEWANDGRIAVKRPDVLPTEPVVMVLLQQNHKHMQNSTQPAPTQIPLRQGTACPIYPDQGIIFDSQWSGDPIHLTQAAFKEGTLIIDSPGVYYLEESITFDPQTPMSTGVSGLDSSFPDPASETYSQLGGYFLGFFAAISIMADNVTLDCKGNTVKMSETFHKRQRFFANIELGSKPFITGTGTSEFGNTFLAKPPFVTPKNVLVQNCKLGLSSQYGIHGNDNKGVVLKNLEIKDFEVGGIALNGSSHVTMEDVQVGSSRKGTFRAQLSQADFIDRLMSTLMQTRPSMYVQRRHSHVTLRGKEHSADEIFNKLRSDLRAFYESNDGPLAAFAGDGQEAPDGSTVYGIRLNKSSDIYLKEVEISDLEVDSFQMTSLVINGSRVMGPAGDLFDWNNNVGSNGEYVGNSFSDAQIAVGAFKKYLIQLGTVEFNEVNHFFGTTNIPDSVLDWAASADGDKLMAAHEFQCNADAMGNHNQGAVGLILDYISGEAHLEDIVVSDVRSKGQVIADANMCVAPQYKGGDSHGVTVRNSPVLTSMVLNDDVTVDSVSSDAGEAIEIDVLSS